MKVWLGMLLAVAICGDALAATRMYRYENDQGIKVIDYQVPPEYVGKGYEVLNSQGRVIEVVPRALTPAELAAKSRQEQKKQDQLRQAEQDKKLLSIFSGSADAERARDRKIEAIDVNINVTRGNILKLRQDFQVVQAQAAERERSGQKVPEFQLDNIESLQRQIDSAEESIVEKEKEKDVIRAEYAKDIERLRELEKMRKAAAGSIKAPKADTNSANDLPGERSSKSSNLVSDSNSDTSKCEKYKAIYEKYKREGVMGINPITGQKRMLTGEAAETAIENARQNVEIMCE